MATKLVVSAANSALGRVLLERALLRPELEAVALVRSARAEAELPPLPRERARALRVDYGESAALREACAGAAGVIHLAGILIESHATRYPEANVETCRALVDAARAAGVPKFVLVSAVGADARSPNPFWRSKGEAEALVRASGLAYTILRLPLVLGCKNAGVQAVAREVKTSILPLPGGGANIEQPIDARDAADGALQAALALDCARDATLDLVGPESIALRELVQRAARLIGRNPYVVPVPVALVRVLLGLRTKLFGPGFSPDVIDVMLADSRFDPAPAAKALGIELRPLDETLAHSLALMACA
jgi:NADH dehydrogenase